MILKTLVENTSISSEFKHKHGVCFYIETKNHKILFDLGRNGLFIDNAKKMGVNISDIDIVIISHGHMDHGGALKLFLENNSSAKVYVRDSAFNEHYTTFMGFKLNVAIDSSLKNHPQVILTGNKIILDEELTLFSDVEAKYCVSTSNKSLLTKVGNDLLSDDFSHEQNLIISEKENLILITGCSHAGIINIRDKAENLLNNKITHIIGGFHLYNPISKKRESNNLIEEITTNLNDNSTYYYTCHCTGTIAFNKMKETLCDRLNYLSTGSEIEI